MKNKNLKKAEITRQSLENVKGGISGIERFCPRCGALCHVIYMEQGAFQFECSKCSYISEVIIL